jgi:hypothetical protein
MDIGRMVIFLGDLGFSAASSFQLSSSKSTQRPREQFIDTFTLRALRRLGGSVLQ